MTMQRHVIHILAVAAFLSLFCSCSKGPKIIPRAKFARIYAEMFVADAWLNTSPSDVRRMADTTAFYEPIFKSFGYTTEDYLASVSYYLNDPDRFSRILKKAASILETDVKSIQEEMERRVSEPFEDEDDGPDGMTMTEKRP